ncbi:type I polyketide synthase [Amycolatopsis pithecellobii]|uniref:6-deoxyerythronolide-B synthase n=1 Tax=Amycolatopsis pithecellobii TaxID=664692 RepID=A0A6N7Z2U9_9PSEU|nr:type I polyketide synthase [Amycolatopsis pithecellobii]MTD54310.1 SDR family NAD(P)-dependent oxidoreductase [Amycolatopsis pithecellobii]
MTITVHDYLREPARSDASIAPVTLIEAFFATVAKDPDGIAASDGDRELTWKQWQEQSFAVARGLRELGAGPGDVIAVRLPNCVDFLVLHVAVAMIGGVFLPLHVDLGQADLESILSRTAPTLLVLPAKWRNVDGREAGAALRATITGLGRVLVADGAEDDPESLAALARRWAGSRPEAVETRPDSPFLLFASSGTTSMAPKICMHSYRGLLSNAQTVIADGTPVSPADTILSCSQLSFAFGLLSAHIGILTGARQALLRTWAIDRLVSLVAAVRPTVLYAVPPQLRDVVAELRDNESFRLPRLREIRTGGSLVPESLVRALMPSLADHVIVQWGMSELGAGMYTRPGDPAEVMSRTVGLPGGGSRARVVDDEGRPCAAGVVGNLEYDGPSVFRGYYRAPEATEQAFTADGWLRTGDLASIDSTGAVTIHGRVAGLINVGGLKVNAAEIEGLLEDFAPVRDSVLVAIPDQRLGEIPALLCTVHDGAAVSLVEVTDHLVGKGTSTHKLPTTLRVVDDLPRTATGKVARRRAQEMLRALVGDSGHDGDGPAGWPAGLPAAEREKALAGLVRDTAAEVLGHPWGQELDDKPFKELGFDSLTAVRLRNRLQTETGLSLPSTVAFDYPTVTRLARYLAGLSGPQSAVASSAVVAAPVTDDPIVIVGMACRFPGGVADPDDLWRLVIEETDAITPFPADRGWNLAELLGTEGPGSGASATAEGGFLDGVDEFDAGFFGISPREALATDPQQRLVLETSWEALEHAGIVPSSLAGSATGVFVGAFHSGYAELTAPAAGHLKGHLITGVAGSVLSGRVAYTLGLEGPAITVDTACSSSLVALHLAAQALRAGECDLALAGGVTVLAGPSSFVEFTQQGGLAGNGRCKAFADAADGTGWSEGAGVVVVERLSAARRNGHRVLAVLRSSAINQDGASNGLTAPNGPSQQRVIKRALASAGLSPAEVDVVEAHGTGTKLGDPIEAQALLAAYGQDRPGDRPLWLGSLKSNIGHTGAAAGIAGVIKMVLAMRHGKLPRTLHVDRPSTHVDWSAGAVRLLTRTCDWPETGHPRRAGVSAFGISGTNAHVILESPPRTGDHDTRAGVPRPAPSTVDDVIPWVLSGKTADAARAQAARLARHVEDRPALDPVDVGWSLLTSRTMFEHRIVVAGTSRDELLSGLRAAAAGRPAASVWHGTARSSHQVAMLFTGQGAQWAGMAQDLYGRSPVFAAALDTILAELDPLLDRPLREVIWGGDAGLVDETGWAQPALFAVEAALFELLRALGVTPGYLLGHSIGEVTAAYVAGVLSLSDACRMVAARARLMQALPRGGAMAAVEMSEAEVAGILTDGVSVAAVNTGESVVISGPAEKVAHVSELVEARGRKVRRLAVSHAFHSALMEPMLAEFREVLETLSFRPPRIPVVSNLTGCLATAAQLCSPAYWTEHVRETVRFADGVRFLAGQGVTALVELGPDGVLSALARSGCDPGTVVVPLLRRRHADHEAVLSALAQLSVAGVEVDWTTMLAGHHPVPLPLYAFQRRRFWPESDAVQTKPLPISGPADERFWAPVDRHDVGALAQLLDVDAGAAATMMPALASWHSRRNEEKAVARWRYRETWKPCKEPAGGPSGRWLVVVPEGMSQDAWGRAVVDALGTDALVLEHGGTDRGALTRKLRDLAGTPVTGVASLLAVWETSPTAGLVSTTLLVQALRDAGMTAPIWAVTRGAVSVGRHDPITRPWQGGVWGLGRVAALEHPGQWGGLVDLPERLDPRTARRLAAAISQACGEDQIAIRSPGMFGRRLVPAPPAGLESPSWTTSGTALITGGTGGLGAHVARWLVGRGARHVVLLSRRGPDAGGAGELRAELETAGAGVTVLACDVADRQALAAAVAGIPAEFPLRTVVHAAGVMGDGAALMSLTPHQLEAGTRAKVAGAWHLDELTRDADLDAFVLFSSGAAAWGSSGQAAYAAGNACLDSLAGYRRAQGRTATSVAWGTWDETGMLIDSGPGHRDHLRRLGVAPMRPRLAITALEHVLARDEATAIVADLDWTTFAPVFTSGRPSPLLSDMPGAGRTPHEHRTDGEPAEVVQRLAGLPAGEREKVLTELVRDSAATVLGHASGGGIPGGQRFTDLGLDSLTAVELCGRLCTITGLRLPVGTLFDHPTPAALTTYLLAELLPGAEPAVTGAVDFESEIVLADDVTPAAEVMAVCRAPKNIFLTGATGFLGAFLLRDLMLTTDAVVHCLVRGTDEAVARERLRANARWYGTWDAVDPARLSLVVGDLEQPRFGLTAGEFDRLAQTADVVYHAGAAVNWLYRYPALKAANVSGTAEILRLAASHRTVAVHYVSSTGVFAGPATPGVPLKVDEPTGPPQLLPNGYRQSKWVAEQVVDLARERGLPVSVYRADIISGAQDNGACQTLDFVWLSMRGMLRVNAVPAGLRGHFHLVPADYVSRAIVDLSGRSDATGGTFHLTNPVPVSFREMVGYLRSFGYLLEELDRETWQNLIRSDHGNPLTSLLEEFEAITSPGGEASYPAADPGETERALEGSGIECPSITRELFKTYVGFFVQSGYFPAPDGALT